MYNGLLVVHTRRESIKIGPPLTISTKALIEGVNVLEKSIVRYLVMNIRHIGLVVKNLNDSLKFWRNIIGFKIKKRKNMKEAKQSIMF